LKLSLSGVLTQRAHNSSQLLRRDGAVTILVEQRERLLELSNLLLCADKAFQSEDRGLPMRHLVFAISPTIKPLWISRCEGQLEAVLLEHVQQAHKMLQDSNQIAC